MFNAWAFPVAGPQPRRRRSATTRSTDRPTRRSILAAVRAEFVGEHVGRNNPWVRSAYEGAMGVWRHRQAERAAAQLTDRLHDDPLVNASRTVG